MIAPRWRKLIGDTRAARGRLLLLAGSIMLSMLAATALLVAADVLDRELSQSFKDARPASAILHMADVTEDVVAAARSRPGIAAAEAAGAMTAKIRTRAGEWLPLQLTVVPDFAAMRIDTFSRESGAWPPPPATLLIERSGVELLGFSTGEQITLQSFAGEQRTLGIAGLVHDETRPPSTQEMTIYGYLTPATLSSLDAEHRLDRLKVIVAHAEPTTADIEAIVRPLAVWLRERGQAISLITIPPPGEHPHQWQYESIALLLLSFAILGLILASLLLAILVSGMLAPQLREIAVMKAIGARSAQIAALYLSLIGVVALSAVAIGVPAGVLVGWRLVDVVANLVNVGIDSYAVSPWNIALCVAVGLALPIASAAMPVWTASRQPVCESLDDHGVGTAAVAARRSGRLHAVDPIIALSVRNALRRKRRFALTVALLTMAGAVFLTAGNMLNVWQNVSAAANEQRRYDMQVWLLKPLERQQAATLAGIAGIARIETIDARTAYIDRGDGVSISGAGRTALALRFVTPRTTMLQPALIAGRWLAAGDSHAIVVNSVARDALFPGSAVGDTLALLVDGRAIRVNLIGIISEPLSGGAAYATPQLLDTLSDHPGHSHGLRIALAQGYSSADVEQRLRDAVAQLGSSVSYVGTRAAMRRAEDAHVYVLILLLALIVAATAAVGGVGLTSTMSTSIIQRTREIGIMRAMGARAVHIYKNVSAEAALVGATSWLCGVLCSIPLTIAVFSQMRRLSFQALALRWSTMAALVWLGITLCVCLAACYFPARRAANLRVTAALARS